MAAVLDRTLVRASGEEAETYLQSMLSNDVAAAPVGGGVYALLLTPKARIIADLEVFRTAPDEFVLAAPPEAVEDALATLRRFRLRRRVELEPWQGAVVWGDGDGALAALDSPVGSLALVAGGPPGAVDRDRFEIARVEAGMPRFGREFGPTSMPAEAGVVERAVSFTKGCYPGQEPVARLHYRGHANRGVRGLAFAAAAPEPGALLVAGEREVGRVTSVVESPRFGPIGLGVLRREVADGERVDAAGRVAEVRPLPFR